MTEQGFSPVEESVREVLTDWAVGGAVDPQSVAALISEGVAHWQTRLPDGSELHLLRFHSPLVQREEVFLGNVLLNDFLFKALGRAVGRLGIERCAPVANDLENAYYLAIGNLDTSMVLPGYRQEVASGITNLYFGEEDVKRGIHGSPSLLLNFTKSDFEPFPVYCVPAFLAAEMERNVRKWITGMLDSEDYARKLKTVMSMLAFFYGQKAGGNFDTQSFEMFLYRLVTHYGVLDRSSLRSVFGLNEVSKPAIKDAVSNGQFEADALRELLLQVGRIFWKSIDGGDDQWLMKFIRDDRKLIDVDQDTFVGELLAGIQLGESAFVPPVSNSGVPPCPMCGRALPRVRESYISTFAA